MELTALIAALSDPRAFGRPDASVRVIQTHISVVFLVADEVFKLKKPVDLEFLDYSSADKRRRFCDLEAALNRRLAPDVYLGTLPVVQTAEGLRVGAEGEVVDWVVHMRRLPDDARLGARIAAGQADAALLRRIGGWLAAFHRDARRGPDVSAWATFAAVATNCRQNFSQLAALAVASPPLLARLERLTEDALTRGCAAIEDRARRLVACDAHGDLRLEHIYWSPERPPPGDLLAIDCVEFGAQFRCADPVADLAFLVMDLHDAGRPDLSEALLAGYFAAADDVEGRALLPLYTAYRATVRAKVDGFRASEPEVPAAARAEAALGVQRHLLLALRELSSPGLRPCLVLVVGLPGTGKSTLARALAQEGLTWVRSDAVRKQLAGLAEHESGRAGYDEGIYSPAWSERTYAACQDLARARLLDGERVVVDANFRADAQRRPFFELARSLGVPILVFVCVVPEDLARLRLAQRVGDASDADADIYARARAQWQPLAPEHAAVTAELDASRAPEDVSASALARLRAAGLA